VGVSLKENDACQNLGGASLEVHIKLQRIPPSHNHIEHRKGVKRGG
jgi:hypothetical protein